MVFGKGNQKGYVPPTAFKKGHKINLGRYPTPEIKQKMSERHRDISEDTRKKMRDSQRGHLCSEETKQRMSDAARGNKNAEGTKHTLEWKKKISLRLKGNKFNVGRQPTLEQKQKQSNSMKNHLPSTTFKLGNIPWNKGRTMSTEIRQKIRVTILNLEDFRGNKGAAKHQFYVNKIANSLKEKFNNVKVEETVKIDKGRRIIDILVDNKVCYEIGQCRKNKIEDLLNNGYEVIHLPYSELEGEDY